MAILFFSCEACETDNKVNVSDKKTRHKVKCKNCKTNLVLEYEIDVVLNGIYVENEEDFDLEQDADELEYEDEEYDIE